MQRAHERIMLNITWRDHKTAQSIRDKTGVRDIIGTIRKLKWQWAGHVARMSDNRWTTRLTAWIPRDRIRNSGRQNMRWCDKLENIGYGTPTIERSGESWGRSMSNYGR